MILWYVSSPLFVVVAIFVVLRHLRREFATMSWSDYRLLKSLPVTPVEALKPGLVKLVGNAKAEQGVMSYYDRQPCILLRRGVTTVSGYSRVGRTTVTHTYSTHEWTAVPFQLDDGTGFLWVDPRLPGTRVDYETGNSDENSDVQEQFIRLGDRVTVIGEIEMLPNADTYRTGARTRDASNYARFRGPVFVSWRSDEDFLPKVLPPWPALALGAVGLAGMAAATIDGQIAMVGLVSIASMVMGAIATAHVSRFA